MSDDDIKITVDGQTLTARKGQMLIEVTDAAGIDIPRFCYHKKLSVAANCRMCLVEVEKAPKPLPACATPVMPDMVVKTQSEVALDAQKGTMEFLLINHPLDCPICDQGGECELQDVAMGYGGGVSQYTEGKRVVMDKYIGPLIATEMTRCIHCTRCVRFGEEVAGIRELGATGRGEDVRIGTYIEKSVSSEVSGNVIDVCPVGALTARPSRYTARSWELTQMPSVAPHDSVGSNIYIHLDNGRVNRVVPRENESVNEVWISDRDRFSYQGIDSSDRLTAPLIRVDGKLVETDWETALGKASEILNGARTLGNLGVLASPSSTLEELYLVQKLCRGLGSNNVDHRLGQSDFSGDGAAPVMPWLSMSFDELEKLDAAFLIGSNTRKDQPIAAIRLRKSVQRGGKISFLNPRKFPLHFEASQELTCRYDKMTLELLCVAIAANADLSCLSDVPDSLEISDAHRQIASELNEGDKSVVMLGNLAAQHPSFNELRVVGAALAIATGSILSQLPERSNTCGAWLAGAVPHRKAGGVSSAVIGLNAGEMLTQPLDVYLTLGVETEFDALNPGQALRALSGAKNMIALSAFMSDSLQAHATVVLPTAVFTETYATWVNAAGSWQSAKGLVNPPGDARPGWKVLRVLGDRLGLDGFQHVSPEQVTEELQKLCESVELNNLLPSKDPVEVISTADRSAGSAHFGTTRVGTIRVSTTRDGTTRDGATHGSTLLRAGETPIYATDPLVRRSVPLQNTDDAKSQVYVRMSGADAHRLGLADGDNVSLVQSLDTSDSTSSDTRHTGKATLPVKLDASIPEGSVWLPGGIPQTSMLGALYAPIDLTRV